MMNVLPYGAHGNHACPHVNIMLSTLLRRSHPLIVCVLAGLVTMVALTGLLSASAYAGPVWKINGTSIPPRSVQPVGTIFTTMPTRFRRAGSTLIVECTTLIDREQLLPGGRDRATELYWTGCRTPPPGSLNMPDIRGLGGSFRTWLYTVSSHAYDEFEDISFDIPEVNGADEVIGEEEVTGNLVGEWSNSTSALTFPETPLEEDTLKGIKGGVEISGGDEFKLAGSGTITVGEETEKEEKERKEEQEHREITGTTWLCGEKTVAKTKECLVVSENLEAFLIEDTGVEAAIECAVGSVLEEGWVGPGSEDETTAVEFMKPTEDCKPTSKALNKKEEEVSNLCEKVLSVQALDLPWSTKVELVGGLSYDKIGPTTNGQPGYLVECKTILGNVDDKCLSPTGKELLVEPTDIPKNGAESPSVAMVFPRILLHGNVEAYECSIGGKESGLVVGEELIEWPSGALELS